MLLQGCLSSMRGIVELRNEIPVRWDCWTFGNERRTVEIDRDGRHFRR